MDQRTKLSYSGLEKLCENMGRQNETLQSRLDNIAKYIDSKIKELENKKYSSQEIREWDDFRDEAVLNSLQDLLNKIKEEME